MDYPTWKNELETLCSMYQVPAQPVIDFARKHTLYEDGYSAQTAFDDWNTNQTYGQVYEP